MNNGLIPLARLQALMGQSIDALAEILADRSLPAGERADLALGLLSLGLGAGSAPAPAPNADAGLPLQSVTSPTSSVRNSTPRWCASHWPTAPAS